MVDEHSQEGEAMTRQRFFFVHVHKTAGTSLFARLQRHFAPNEIYPDDSDVASVAPGSPLPRLTPTLLVSHLVERYRLRRDEIRVVAGHFPLQTTELLGDPFVTFTVLRDPVARTMSALRRLQERSPADQDR